jgi:MerR family mercuric resistance operon transcriptional regulator/MerR family gold-responsive transcriptional activator of gol and ges genes
LLNLRVSSTARCGDVQRRAQAKLAKVEAKLKDLESMARVLKDLIKSCRAGQPTDRCPILKSLEEQRRSDHGNRQATR